MVDEEQTRALATSGWKPAEIAMFSVIADCCGKSPKEVEVLYGKTLRRIKDSIYGRRNGE